MDFKTPEHEKLFHKILKEHPGMTEACLKKWHVDKIDIEGKSTLDRLVEEQGGNDHGR
jgi:hypothetical protein